MEENMTKPIKCYDAGDISASIFQLLGLGKEHDIERNVTGHCLMPSLGHMALVKIVIALWNHASVRDQIIDTFQSYQQFFRRLSVWEKIEHQLLAKVSELPLPGCILKMLMSAVKPIGEAIFQWIEYQDDQIFHVSETRKSVAVYYVDDLAWTPSGRVDIVKTAKVMLSKDGLSDDTKYRIACTFCLKDDIVDIAPKVVRPSYLHYANGGRKNGDSRTMMRFWACHLVNDPVIGMMFPTFVSSDMDNFHLTIFKQLISSMSSSEMNLVATKYVWQQLSDEEKEQYVFWAVECVRNVELKVFLLSQATARQRKELFNNCSNAILEGFITDWLWKDYLLPTMGHMWEDMSANFYFFILTAVAREMAQGSQDVSRFVNPQNKIMFRGLWECAPDHLRQCAFDDRKDEGVATLLSLIFCRENLDIIQLILSSVSSEERKKIIHSEHSINTCAFFVMNSHWDLLEEFVALTLFSKEDVDNFKRTFAEKRGHLICIHYIEKNELDKLDQFSKWCFASRKGVDEFMQLILGQSDVILRKLLEKSICELNGDFTLVENLLKWIRFKAGVNGFKSKKLQKDLGGYGITPSICRLILTDRYELVEKTLNWCFSNDRKKIKRFKNDFYDEPNETCLQKLIVSLIRNEENLQPLNKFFHWWFASKAGKRKFIAKVIKRTQQNVWFWEILDLSKFSLKADFMKWCEFVEKKH